MALQGLPVETALVEGSKISLGWRNWLDLVVRKTLDRLNTAVLTGLGSPAGVVVASRGQIYIRTDGGASTSLYVKESGDGTTAGWVAK
jgi:hypothetical protein